MDKERRAVEHILAEKKIPLQQDMAASTSSVPLQENPGVISHIWDFTKSIFGDFYNLFRLTGYFAENYYSAAVRRVGEWLNIKEGPEPSVRWSDWKISRPRSIINTVETGIYLTAALVAFFRDRSKFRSDIGNLVAAEQGKEKNKLTMKDMFHSQNPLLQTAMNRFKSLYLLRLFQPFSFLWSLKAGVSTTVFEIVAERAAYFERNSYDQMQRLVKEVHNNQVGYWSKDTMVARLIDIMQQNRAEHNAAPITVPDLKNYFPLLEKVADDMIEKKFGFSEVLYVVGQIIREPALPQKAFEKYDALKVGGLAGLTPKAATSQAITPVIPVTDLPQPANDNPAGHSSAIKDILHRGAKPPGVHREVAGVAATY